MPILSHTRSARILLIMILSLSCIFSGVLHAPAVPVGSDVGEAREKVVQARDRLDDLAADLEERTEDFLEVEHELNLTRGRIEQTERELSKALLEVDSALARLNGRATAIYRNGPVSVINVLVGATDFRDFITRVDLMQRIGLHDAALVATVVDVKERVETTRATLERRREEQIVLRNRARRAQTGMQVAVVEQKVFLSRLDDRLKKLIAEEKARQERLARERAAAAARRAAAGTGGRAGRPFDPSALGPSRADVVPVARRFVDKVWYLWGGTTPDGFDCSGLTLYCYREIGVSLPRTSRQQYKVGAYIPPDRLDLLAPGDLVFFGREGDPGRIHHVGIYIGDGDMIHAPQTGEKVSVASLVGRIARRGDYVGAVRP